MSNKSIQRGFSNAEAEARLARHGPNALPERAPLPLWRRFLRQFQSPLIYILLFALVTDAAIWLAEGAHGLPLESVAIALILLLNAGLGVYQENKAEAALAHLKALATAQVWVVRAGQLTQLPSVQLVPGDIVRSEAGDRIPADGKLIEGQGWLVDEAVLTGESLPVEKAPDEEVFSGTLLVRVGLRNATGELLLPVTAVQLLWINIITDGPPALALGLDQSPGVMQMPSRAPQAPLLDRSAGRFILLAGSIMTLLGGALLVSLPRLGYSLEVTRSAIFLYITICQLTFAYPARHIGARPQMNFALHLSVILGIGLQLLTVFVPWLRVLLGLTLPDAAALLSVALAVLSSWSVAEIATRWGQVENA